VRYFKPGQLVVLVLDTAFPCHIGKIGTVLEGPLELYGHEIGKNVYGYIVDFPNDEPRICGWKCLRAIDPDQTITQHETEKEAA
jgi:hypothetical protein